jgi:hypothetical protein
MGVRNFRYATSDNSVSGETVRGAGSDKLIYQTSPSTPPASLFQGTSIGSVKGPEETDRTIAAFAHRDINSAGANGTTYDVTFYGGATSSESAQIAAINGAVNQADSEGIDISGLGGYPYTSDVESAAVEVNSEDLPLLVIVNGTIS